MILYHYTCDNLAGQIRQMGLIMPVAQPELDGTPLIWLSDYRMRTKHLFDRLGLDWHTNRRRCADVPDCDPLAVRFAVPVREADGEYVKPFAVLEPAHPGPVAVLRSLPGAHTWRWWISTVPIRLAPPRSRTRPSTVGEVRV